MVKCVDITPKIKKMCVSALRNKIGIYDRDLVGVVLQGNSSHKEIYTLFKETFSAIETRKSQVLQTLDGVSIDPGLVITHIFTIRFRTGVTTEQFIQRKGINYKILKTENIDEADNWLRLSANSRGDLTKAGAQ